MPERTPARPEVPRRRRWPKVLVVVAAIVVAGRLALPGAVRWYVNRVFEAGQLYRGTIGDVDVHLWRGAYSIDDVEVFKTTGNVPVPFFAAARLDLAIEWSALLHGEVVGRVVMEQPKLAFVDAEDAARRQTGDGPWLEVLSALFPFKINSAEVRDGRIAFRAFRTEPPVDVYLSEVRGTVSDLTNITEDLAPLFAKVRAHAKAMDDAELELEVDLDAFAYRPTFKLALRLLGLDVEKVNSLARAYGNFDFEHGWLDLVVELDAKEGFVEGYVKPLFRNLRVFDVGSDLRVDVLSTFWEALVGLGGALFKNQPHDQLATVIPVRGQLTDPRTDLLSTLANLLRNAFVRAYLPRFQGTAVDRASLTFGPGLAVEPAPK